MKRFQWPLLAVLVALLGFGLWRRANPPLSPVEQVEQQLNGLTQAVEKRHVGNAASYLAPDFAYEGSSGANKADIVDGSRGAFFSWRDVKIELSGVQTTVEGDTAQSRGNVRMQLRPSPDAPLETRKGTFAFTWAKRNGQWKITRARGGEDVVR